MSSYIDPLSYITVVIACHGNDSPTQRLNPLEGVSIRKLTMVGRSGTAYFKLDGSQEEIFNTFQRVKASNPGLRFDRMLEMVRDQLRASELPRMLSLSSTLIERMVIEEMKKTGAPNSVYSTNVKSDVSDWVQYTSTQYEHIYSFEDTTGEQNHGIWIVDSSHVSLSLREPKDIYCSYTKSQGLSWEKGPSILISSEMYYRGVQPTQPILISELARRLAVKYRVSNVNFIDLSCRVLSSPHFVMPDDSTPSYLVTATPRANGARNIKPVIGVAPKSRTLPTGWEEEKDRSGNTFYRNLAGRVSYTFPSILDFDNPVRAPDTPSPSYMTGTPKTQRAVGQDSYQSGNEPSAHKSSWANLETTTQVPVAYRSDPRQYKQPHQQQYQQQYQEPYQQQHQQQYQEPYQQQHQQQFQQDRSHLSSVILKSYANGDDLIIDMRRKGYSLEQIGEASEAWARHHSRGGKLKKSRIQNRKRQTIRSKKNKVIV
jgi:hypothetical protein